MSNRRNVMVALLWIGALLTGCVAPSATTTPEKAAEFSGGRVVVRLAGAWDNMDPHRMVGTNAWGPASAMYDRLISFTPDGKFIPYLAKSWEVLPDSYAFTLRTDAVCADGTPVTSTVVANSLKRFFQINGYYATEFGGPVTVTNPEADRVVVKLSIPNTNVLYDFARPVTSIVCPAGLVEGADFTTKSFGSGPYTLVQAIGGDRAIVTARSTPWTWGPNGWKSSDPGFPRSIEYPVVTNPTTAANLLLTGGADVTTGQGPEIVRLNASPGLIHKVAKSTVADVIAYGHAPAQPTSNETVREALSRAIDPAALIQAYAAGFADPATSTIGPITQCYDPEVAKLMPTYDLNKAKALLTSIGYVAGPDGKLMKDGKPLAITVTASNVSSAPDYIFEQYQKLGITTTLQKVDQTTYGQLKFANRGDAFFNPLLGEQASHNINIQQLSGPTGGNRNPQLINDPIVDNAVIAARQSVGAENCRQWGIVQRTLVGKYHALPTSLTQVHWYSKNVEFEPVASSFLDALTLRKKS